MTMTPEELYRRANTEMTNKYETGIRCMEDAKTLDSIRFFRDFTQGEIDGIADFSTNMYLAIIYSFDNTDLTEEDRTYIEFCVRIRERAYNLKKLLTDYSLKFL